MCESMAPVAPAVRALPQGTPLWHVQPTEDRDLRPPPTFFTTDEDDVPWPLIPYVAQDNPGKPIQVSKFETKRQILLFELGPEYPFTSFERWIKNVDPAYVPSFDGLGWGDNYVAARWLLANGARFGVDGWSESAGALPVMSSAANETMLLHTDPLTVRETKRSQIDLSPLLDAK